MPCMQTHVAVESFEFQYGLSLSYIYSIAEKTYSVVKCLKESYQMSYTAVVRNMMTRVVPVNSWYSNYKFTLQASLLLFSSTLNTWLYVLLRQAGDMQPNSGPSSNHSSLHDLSTSSSFLNSGFSN